MSTSKLFVLGLILKIFPTSNWRYSTREPLSMLGKVWVCKVIVGVRIFPVMPCSALLIF